MLIVHSSGGMAASRRSSGGYFVCFFSVSVMRRLRMSKVYPMKSKDVVAMPSISGCHPCIFSVAAASSPSRRVSAV